MTKLSNSPKRNTFQAEKYLERKAEEGKTPENNKEVAAMMDYYKSWNEQKAEQEADPAWQKDNMEWDLRTTDWILEKVRNSDAYAQNLYAAMCNNDFTKREMWPILKEQKWSCSWRYAGGVIADMRQEGDYIDWYCSGIRNDGYQDDLDVAYSNGYVPESFVTEEIEQDLYKLGWLVVKYDDTKDV